MEVSGGWGGVSSYGVWGMVNVRKRDSVGVGLSGTVVWSSAGVCGWAGVVCLFFGVFFIMGRCALLLRGVAVVRCLRRAVWGCRMGMALFVYVG